MNRDKGLYDNTRVVILVGWHVSKMPKYIQWVDREKFVTHLNVTNMIDNYFLNDNQLEYHVEQYFYEQGDGYVGLHKKTPRGNPSLFGYKAIESLPMSTLTFQRDELVSKLDLILAEFDTYSWPHFMSDIFKEFITETEIDIINYIQVN